MNEAEKTSLSTKTLVFGILSIALGGSAILGIIFGAIASSNAKKYAAANNGVVDGKAKVGKILGTLGLVFGIIALVVYIILAIVGAVAGTALNSGSFNF